MEVIIPDNFDFNSARSSPHVSPPSTPKRFGECYYYSAPTSPSHLSQFYRDSGSGSAHSGSARIPFAWEEKPGTPKLPVKNENFDFAFEVSEDWETASMSAEELFDGGMIKPLKPPPRSQLPAAVRVNEKKTSPRWKKPPLQKTKTESDDPFLIAAQNAMKSAAPERGRERAVNLPNSTSRRAARSLSPLRDTPSFSKSQKKWSIKDFFLFRSASEGRAAEKDPLKKYTAAFRHSSFRAADSPISRRKGPVSAHEAHYTVNRAVSEDLKKKTFLPYKQGILGRLAFNPAVHALANGFGFSKK